MQIDQVAAVHPVIARIIAEGEPILREYGYPAVAVTNFAEGVGVPLPGQMTLMAGALLSDRGDFQIGWIVAIAFAAAVAGSCAGYWIGWYGGRRLLERLPVRHERLARAEGFFERRALGLVFLARFLDGFRQVVPLLAGTLKMPWWRFFGATLAGSGAWVGLWGGGVYLFGHDLHALALQFYRLGEHAWWLAAIALVLLLVWLLLRR